MFWNLEDTDGFESSESYIYFRPVSHQGMQLVYIVNNAHISNMCMSNTTFESRRLQHIIENDHLTLENTV